MKKLIYFLAIIPFVAFTSCFFDDEDKFSETATERVNKELREYAVLLPSKAEGWVLEFWTANTGTHGYFGGTNYIVQFLDHENLRALSEESSASTLPWVQSHYSLVKDQGPVLSFDSYNSLLHYYAVPANGLQSARGGDFEFTFMSKTNSEIILKGKKFDRMMKLRELQTSPEEFIKAMQASASPTRNQTYRMLVNDDEIATVAKSQKVLTFTWDEIEVDDQGQEYVETYSGRDYLIYTEEGFKLYEEQELLDYYFYEFEWDNSINGYRSIGVTPEVLLVP